MNFNEGKVLDALLYRLEKRDGILRCDVTSPDREGHRFPVDLKCKLGDRLYAIEHTGIEPFENHIEGDVRAGQFFNPVKTALAGQLPLDSDFELHVPIHAASKINRRAVGPIRQALIDWIRVTAPTISINPLGRLLHGIRDAQPPRVPFNVSLFRCQTLGNGLLNVIHIVSNVEAQRSGRIKRAFDKKRKNLDAWKRVHGATSVLLLEDNDIQLTNPELVAKAIEKIAIEAPARPDEIFLVTTCAEPWWVTPIWNGRLCYYDEMDPDERFWEVDPKKLKSLTGR